MKHATSTYFDPNRFGGHEITEEMRGAMARYMAALRLGYSTRTAAKISGVSHWTICKWANEFPDFAHEAEWSRDFGLVQKVANRPPRIYRKREEKPNA